MGGVPILAAAEKANVELLVLQAMDRILKGKEEGKTAKFYFVWKLFLLTLGTGAHC